LSENVYISKYAFEKYEEDINIKDEILTDLISYFDNVLDRVLKNKNIDFRDKTNTQVNIVIPNNS
jgi:hypothetical protein